MTETSGHPDTWTGAKLLFGNLYNALVYGNASAWIWWTLAETTRSAEYGLVVDNQASSRYAISRHFYQAAQPGAVRVGTTSEPDLLSVAFENPDGSLTVVLYNTGKTRLVSCTGAGTLLEAWVSQDGLLSRAAQMEGQSVLLPTDSEATLVFK
jgi:O-glycosyl hydrolase